MKKLQVIMGITAIVLSCVSTNSVLALSKSTEVATKSGPVVGVQAEDGVEMFLGIPYAAPPVGDLRWKSPQPVAPWSEPLVADSFGPACPQKRGAKIVEGTNEDCLRLNVWTPNTKPTKKLPVMVWFHPGSFSINSGNRWVGKNLAKLGDIIVVSMNYRLNVFGFLALEELNAENSSHPTSGNYGLEDQILSLQWVQENIANFGGDPNNVTIYGESSGGMSVTTILVSPKAKGLFHKAITASGPSAAVNKPMATAVKEGAQRLSLLDCPKGDGFLACLRSKSADEVEQAIPPEGGLSGLTWAPVSDNIFLTDSPATLFKQGKAPKDIPMLYLVTKDEQMLVMSGNKLMDIDEDTHKEKVAGLIKSKSDLEKVLKQYDASKYPSPVYALADVLTDRDAKCAIRNEIRDLSKSGVEVYMSHFMAGRDEVPIMKPLGAYHTIDVEFVFFVDEGDEGLNEAEKVLSRSMISYWSSFAHTGNPNATAAGVAWPKYNMESNEQYIEFDTDNISVSNNLFPQCDFWDNL